MLTCGFAIDYALRSAYNNLVKVGFDNVAPKQLEFRKRVEFPAFFIVVIYDLIRRDEVVEITGEVVLPIDRDDEVGLNLAYFVVATTVRSDGDDER